MAFVTPNDGDTILASHVSQLTGLLAGSSGKGQLVQLYQYEDSTNYANVLGNRDTTNGRAVKIQYGDPSGSPVTLATFQKSAVRIQSNDGTDYLDISNSGVAIVGTLTVNGTTVGGGVRVYNVLDHGMVTGTTSTSAAANTSAFQTLLATAAAAGGGVIFFPRGTWPMNATVWSHGLGSTSSISILGEAGATAIQFWGATGPFWSLGSSSSHALSRVRIQNVMFLHGDKPTSGATIKIGANVANIIIDGIYMAETSSGYGPLTGIEALVGFSLSNSKIDTRTDTSTLTGAGLVPRVIHLTNTSAASNIDISNCSLNGCATVSYGIDFFNSGDIDTVRLTNVLIKDNDRSINKSGSPAGDIANAFLTGVYLDVSQYGLYLEPNSGSALYTWLCSGLWVAAAKQAIRGSTANSGTIDRIKVNNGYFTDAATAGNAAVELQANCDNCSLTDVYIGTSLNTGGDYGVDIGGASGAIEGFTMIGCTVVVGSSATNSVRISSACDPVVVTGNTFRGKDITFGGSTGTSRVNANNAYKA